MVALLRVLVLVPVVIVPLAQGLPNHPVEFLELPEDLLGFAVRQLERRLILEVRPPNDDGREHPELLVGLTEVVVHALSVEGV